ncbi:hypothetical protein [Thermococcus alcaliphilus]|uniref:hypothetical protein n=1 Tax=Thermococcus alcaliphilus TaxID=139207 RepID=UPI0020902EEB|nr:hypothetical protein [Thermococcus alcaliphilus]MCO6041167.1 hypothetical protein [Thermococcus alcaliphilus]
MKKLIFPLDEMVEAIKKVGEYQYQVYISEIEDSKLMFTRAISGGMSLERNEGFEEWKTYSLTGELREIYRVAVFDGKYHSYRFRRDEEKVLENVTEEYPLEELVSTENTTSFLKDYFGWPLMTLSVFLKNGTAEFVGRKNEFYVFTIRYNRKEQDKEYVYILNSTGELWVNGTLPVRFLVNITATTIESNSNRTKTAISLVELNLSYSYSTPEWIKK